MFTSITFQDWEASGRPLGLLMEAVRQYKGSAEFSRALEANQYFNGENPEIMKKTVMKLEAREVKDPETGETSKKGINKEVIGCRISSNFLFRFITAQNQYMLGNGVTLESDEKKAKLGTGFDTALSAMGEKALLHGVCWGFWNVDHIEIIPAASDSMSGFVALLDEMTGAPRVGVQFWQLSHEKPLYIRIFEEDGVSIYTLGKMKSAPEMVQEKRPYKLTRRVDGLGESVIGMSNYGVLPVIPLYGNPEKQSELKLSIKQKIDAYDRILSDFGDNLERTNDVYWVINNFGGNTDDIIQMLSEINRIKATYTDESSGGQASAEPHTIEVPYAARQTALSILRKELYRDFMAPAMDELTSMSLSNIALRIANRDLDLKCDRYEWECFTFVQRVLSLIGIKTEVIRFDRNRIENDAEKIQAIYTMRGDIDQETALMLNPYIDNDRIPDILSSTDAEKVSGLSGMDALQKEIEAPKGEE